MSSDDVQLPLVGICWFWWCERYLTIYNFLFFFIQLNGELFHDPLWWAEGYLEHSCFRVFALVCDVLAANCRLFELHNSLAEVDHIPIPIQVMVITF